MKSFHQELAEVINRFGMERGSDTPDHVLAQYLFDSLEAFGSATRRREATTSSKRTPELEELANYWFKRCMQAEDMIESLRVMHETTGDAERVDWMQSQVAKFRRTYKRENTPDFCGEMMMSPPVDLWWPIEDRKPNILRDGPVVRVMYENKEIAESRYWVTYFTAEFLRFEHERDDMRITHWQHKKPE